MLGYSSVKAMKLALISHKDYVRFMNKGNLADRDNVQEYRASKYQGIYDKAVDITGFIASFLPGYRDVIDIQESFSGEDIRTGEKLPGWQRALTVGAALIPFVSGKSVRRLHGGSDEVGVIIKNIDEAGEGIKQAGKHADKLDDAVGAVKGTSGDKGTLTGSVDKLKQAEKNVVNDLLNEGKSVEIILRSNTSGVKTPDFKVDGTLTELKTLNGTSLNTPVSKIQQGFKQGAETVIIDGRASGLTMEQATTVIKRTEDIYQNSVPGKIEIWTNEGIIVGGK